MAREDLRYKLNTLLHKAIKQKKSVAAKNVQVRHNDDFVTIDLIIRPLAETTGMDGLMMVIFETKTAKTKPAAKKKAAAADVHPRIMALEQELQSTKEYLQTTMEEMETSNEELKSTNEELQSTNEELQSTNEELETSREELQSTNEELETVNAELQHKVEQLSGANNDLNNLLGSTEIGTIFLDNELGIKRFTPTMTDLFKLISTDIGRPISDIVHNLKYDTFVDDVKHVLRHLGCIEKEVQTANNQWLFLRIMPYRTLENAIDGVVVTFADITRQKGAQTAAEEARAFADGIVQTVREPLIILDGGLRVISANDAFYKTFKVKPKETEKTLIFDLGNRQWNTPKLRKLLEQILPKNKQFEGFEVSADFPALGPRTILLNARQIYHEGRGTQTILLAMEDVTEGGPVRRQSRKEVKSRAR
jgi:two-component system CheB/CheR fusion protein